VACRQAGGGDHHREQGDLDGVCVVERDEQAVHGGGAAAAGGDRHSLADGGLAERDGGSGQPGGERGGAEAAGGDGQADQGGSGDGVDEEVLGHRGVLVRGEVGGDVAGAGARRGPPPAMSSPVIQARTKVVPEMMAVLFMVSFLLSGQPVRAGRGLDRGPARRRGTPDRPRRG
jgi:hypothetical protein